MRLRTFSSALLLAVSLASLCTAAGIGATRADFRSFDGIPLSVSGDQVLDAVEKVAPSPTPSPQPTQPQSLNCPPTGGGFQCAMQATNRNRPRRRLGDVPDFNAGLTPTQIRAQAYRAQHESCAVPNDKDHVLFDEYFGFQDKDRNVNILFAEADPATSCDVIDTEIFSNQPILAQTVEAQQAIEDHFVAAARAKFGTPTFFTPRHVGDFVNDHQAENNLGAFNSVIGAGNNAPVAATVEKRTIAPQIGWCDTGTVADCKSGGPTVNRRLLLGFVNHDGEVAALDLKDFHALRQIAARTTKANVEQVKPQL